MCVPEVIFVRGEMCIWLSRAELCATIGHCLYYLCNKAAEFFYYMALL